MSGVDAPALRVSLGAGHIDPELIESVEIRDEAEDKDTAVVNVIDPDFRFQGMTAKGAPVTITAGFRAGPTKTFTGEVSGIGAECGENGVPKLVVECSSRAKRGHEGQVNKAWKNMTRSQIAAEIAGKHGWAPRIDETREVIEQETQAGESDVDFLRRLAARENFVFRVKGNVMHFQKAPVFDSLGSVAGFDYRRGNYMVKSFSPRYASDETGKDVEAANINNKTKETLAAGQSASVAPAQGRDEAGELNRGFDGSVLPSEREGLI